MPNWNQPHPWCSILLPGMSEMCVPNNAFSQGWWWGKSWVKHMYIRDQHWEGTTYKAALLSQIDGLCQLKYSIYWNPWELKGSSMRTVPLNFSGETGFNDFPGNGSLVWCLFLVSCQPAEVSDLFVMGRGRFQPTRAAPGPLALEGSLGWFLGCSLPDAAESSPKPNSFCFSLPVGQRCKQLPKEIETKASWFTAHSQKHWQFIAVSII